MLAKTRTVAHWGLDVLPVTIEADTGAGLPRTHLVGKADKTVQESERRILTAFKHTGFNPPEGSLTISLSPSDLPKVGAHYDLPIAVAVALASGQTSKISVEDVVFMGELALNGELRPVNGVLNAARWAKDHDLRAMVVPWDNAPEAMCANLPVWPLKSLDDLWALLWEGTIPECEHMRPAPPTKDALNLNQIRGQEPAKRALEIAAAGNHNLLLIGSPGSGKTLLAKSLPSLLPSLDQDTQLEVTCIHSAAGLLKPGHGLLIQPPFRAPHHSVSAAALIGGGATPRPGEVSLAHRGVLFLDELPEFRRDALEGLRQPLEEHVARVARAKYHANFPARFMFVAAMNPCVCGYLGDEQNTCQCTPYQIERYRNRVSGPLLDRIDIQLSVRRMSGDSLTQDIGSSTGESSTTVATRVLEAQRHQRNRQGKRNGDLSLSETEQHCRPTPEGLALLKNAVDQLGLSARGFHRVMRVARTVADLEATAQVELPHVAEAIQYRVMGKTSGP